VFFTFTGFDSKNPRDAIASSTFLPRNEAFDK
jgi:hypothetical protein